MFSSPSMLWNYFAYWSEGRFYYVGGVNVLVECCAWFECGYYDFFFQFDCCCCFFFFAEAISGLNKSILTLIARKCAKNCLDSLKILSLFPKIKTYFFTSLSRFEWIGRLYSSKNWKDALESAERKNDGRDRIFLNLRYFMTLFMKISFPLNDC